MDGIKFQMRKDGWREPMTVVITGEELARTADKNALIAARVLLALKTGSNNERSCPPT